MNVYLRAFQANDYLLINKWRNNQEIQKLTVSTFFYISEETDRNWVLEKMKYSQKEIYCAICLKETDEMIGYTSLNDIDLLHRKCIWGGIVIGSENGKKKNAAFETGILMMEYAFFTLNLNRVMTRYLESHERSSRLCSRLGFENEGKFRKSVFKHNCWHNEVNVGLLKEDFEMIVEKYKKEKVQ